MTDNPDPAPSFQAPPRRVFVVAGEASGDLHAAELIRAWRQIAPEWSFRGYGGHRMASAGFEVLEDLPSQAIMGLFPVVASLPEIRRWMRRAKGILREERPDLLILVDYPGFNLRLAAYAKALGIPVFYYVSPQVWAWKKRRIRRIARDVDYLVALLPFEPAVYAGTGLDCDYFGHPLVDHHAHWNWDQELLKELQRSEDRPTLGIFPGSRRHVVESLMPLFLECAARLVLRPELEGGRVLVAAADDARAEQIRKLIRDSELPIEIVTGAPYEVMRVADFALSASGTTTLQLALDACPFVLAYQVSGLVYALGKRLVKVPHIGLVNLVAGEEVVPEHVGSQLDAEAIVEDLSRLWTDKQSRETMLGKMDEVKRKLSEPGAYVRTAEAMLQRFQRDFA